MERFEEKTLAKVAKYLEKGKVQAAVEAVQGALSDNPDSVPLLLELSRLQIRLGRRDDMAASVRRALKARADAADEVESFVADLRQAGDEVTPYLEALAEHYLRARDTDRSLAVLERMRGEIPACRDRVLPRAQKLLSETPGRPINPQLLGSVYLVGLCHEILGQFGAAAQIYSTLLDRNPQESETVLARMGAVLVRDHKNLALRLKLIEGLLRCGKQPQALEQCGLALDIDARSAAGPLASLLQRLLPETGDAPALRALLARTLAAEGRIEACLDTLRPLVEKGHDLAGAMTMLEELARRQQEHAGILALLSEVYLARGKGHEALAAFSRLSNPPPEMAEQVYRKILGRDPACAPAAQRLIQLLGETGRAQEAADLCASVVEADPARAAALLPQLQRLLESSGVDSRPHLLAARLLAVRGECERAGLLLRRAVALDPAAAPQVLAILGSLPPPAAGPEARHLRVARLEAHVAAGDHEAATAAAEAALAPDSPALPDALAPAIRLLAASPASAGRLRAALAAHSRAPGCEAAMAFLAADCAAAEGRMDEAIERWRACAAARPETASLVVQSIERERARPGAPDELDLVLVDLALAAREFAAAARTLADVAARRPEMAAACLERFQKLLHERPNSLEVRLGLCSAYTASRHYDQALSLGEETLRLEDSERTASLNLTLADAHLGKGDARRAIKRLLHAFARRSELGEQVIERLQRLRQQAPAQPLVHLALGRVLGASGRPTEALDALAEAWKLDAGQADLVLDELRKLEALAPPSPVLRLLLARIWTGKHDYGKAVESIAQLLDAHPDQAHAVLRMADKILSEAADFPDALLVRGRAQPALREAGRACESFERLYRLDAGQAAALLPWCQKAIEIDPLAAEPYLLACDLNRALKRFSAAAETLAAALARNLPDRERFVQRLAAIAEEHKEDASLLVTLAEEYLALGKGEAALRALSEAVGRDPSVAEPAAEAVERILKTHPELAEGLLVRARLRSRRGSIDSTLADLAQFVRKAPSRRAEALPVIAALRKRDPRHLGVLCAGADLLVEERQYEEASALLKDGTAAVKDPLHKLELYLRQWRLHLAQGKEALARQVLENAQSLAPDRNRFLDMIHRVTLEGVQRQLDGLREKALAGSASAAEIETLVTLMTLLGQLDAARDALSRHGAALERPRFARLHAAIAARRGDYRRALEMGRAAGPDRALVHCAERSGEMEEAHRLLTRLLEEGREVSLEGRLARYELEALRRELDRDRNVLQAETIVSFGT
jgi:tetratricopeptide (TPR) repeat protein